MKLALLAIAVVLALPASAHAQSRPRIGATLGVTPEGALGFEYAQPVYGPLEIAVGAGFADGYRAAILARGRLAIAPYWSFDTGFGTSVGDERESNHDSNGDWSYCLVHDCREGTVHAARVLAELGLQYARPRGFYARTFLGYQGIVWSHGCDGDADLCERAADTNGATVGLTLGYAF